MVAHAQPAVSGDPGATLRLNANRGHAHDRRACAAITLRCFGLDMQQGSRPLITTLRRIPTAWPQAHVFRG